MPEIKYNEFLPEEDFNNLYLWGTYKNQLLYSITQKKPDPITFTLMYYNPAIEKFDLNDIRYKVTFYF